MGFMKIVFRSLLTHYNCRLDHCWHYVRRFVQQFLSGRHHHGEVSHLGDQVFGYLQGIIVELLFLSRDIFLANVNLG